MTESKVSSVLELQLVGRPKSVSLLRFPQEVASLHVMIERARRVGQIS